MRCKVEHRTQAQTAFLMSDSACALFFFSLFIVGLFKASQIVSAGTPEAKPAEAHTSHRGRPATSGRMSSPLPLSSIFPVIVTS